MSGHPKNSRTGKSSRHEIMGTQVTTEGTAEGTAKGTNDTNHSSLSDQPEATSAGAIDQLNLLFDEKHFLLKKMKEMSDQFISKISKKPPEFPVPEKETEDAEEEYLTLVHHREKIIAKVRMLDINISTIMNVHWPEGLHKKPKKVLQAQWNKLESTHKECRKICRDILELDKILMKDVSRFLNNLKQELVKLRQGRKMVKAYNKGEPTKTSQSSSPTANQPVEDPASQRDKTGDKAIEGSSG